MAIIPQVGRKTPRMRLVIFTLYAVLILGALTTVIPFILMLGTSITTEVDKNDYWNNWYPLFLRNDQMLFKKYVEDKYAGNIDTINGNYRADFAKFENICAPRSLPENNPGVKKFAQDWKDFTETLPVTEKQACFSGYLSYPSRLAEVYRAHLDKKFNHDINLLNRTYVEENTDFNNVLLPFERLTRPEWYPDQSPKMKDWMDYKKTLPEDYLQVVGIEPTWATYLKEDVYQGDIAALNKAYKTNYASFADVPLPPTLPTQSPQNKDWETFIRTKLPYRTMVISPEGQKAYISMLQTRYKNVPALNEKYSTHYTSFTQIQLPKILPSEGALLLDYMDFIQKAIPLKSIQVLTPENRFRSYLLAKYGNINTINKQYNTHFASIMAIQPPIQEADWMTMKSHEGAIRKDFALRNYRAVFSYIVLHGRSVVNTLILCIAIILTNLIVNPLCAYALARFNLSYSNKVLLFLLATMAFPAEVAMIPNFLLLKEFHLLNTYWALILPGMANGFSIFLLKGFFDSLPRELYEAGTLDGASESLMFWKITIPLSQPIFAYIALQAFTAAYSSWMWALVVCQDQKMWTLMVWLYEMQTWAPKSLLLAALTVTAIPTLLLFIFCQNIIMRGIIIPSED